MCEDSIAESEMCCADAMVRSQTDLFDNVTFDELQSVFQNWIERLEWLSDIMESTVLND
jgi:hypothetical protein